MLRKRGTSRWFLKDSQEQESVDISSPPTLSSSYFQRVLKAKVLVGTIISQVLLNEGQCEWLESRLREAVECAQDAFSTLPTQRFEQLLRNFYLKVKDVEILVGQCCAKPWLTNAFLFAGIEEYFVLKGQELRWFQALFKHVKQGSESGLWLEGVPILAMFEREEGDHMKVLLQELEDIAQEDRAKLRWNLEEVILKSASVADSDLARNLLNKLPLKSERSRGVAKAAPHVMWKVDPKELEFGKSLGSGAGGARVFETKWLKQPFAGKVFHVSRESLFEQEAAILAVLQHPHILPMVCTAVDSARGTCSLVTELMSEDLQSVIVKNGAFSLHVALDLMLQVAEGMKFLHEKRVVHKDLKSTNILVRPVEDPNLASEGFVCAKVADFGLSKTKEESATRSQLTLNVGTTRWMAPELLEVTNLDGTSYSLPNKELAYHFRVDVYSYAITFSEVLTGWSPYHNLSSNTKVKEKVMAEYLRPELPVTCPIGLATLIVKCWDQDASQRPSFVKISKELRHIMGQMLMGVQPSFALEPLSKLYEIVAGEGPFISSSWPEPLAAFMERFRKMETTQNICNALRHIQGLLFTEGITGGYPMAPTLPKHSTDTGASDGGMETQVAQPVHEGGPSRMAASRSSTSRGRKVKPTGATPFTMAELSRITGNFSPSNKIGEGGFGMVYKGRLKDGRMVAIKRGKKDALQQRFSVEFRAEVDMLSEVDHLNLVKLIGYIEDEKEQILVLEYVPNGNLREHLNGTFGKVLDMRTRLEIAIDIAHALTYLHNYAIRPIIHRGVQSSNILLTENFLPKVADFGFSRVGPSIDGGATLVSTQEKGTEGYLDPEYPTTGHLNTKSDVYSFGILLVEIFTGRRPIELQRGSDERVTMSWAITKFVDGKLIDILDPKIERTPAAVSILEGLLKLAFTCSAPGKIDRPSMFEATKVLWEIRKRLLGISSTRHEGQGWKR